ncbi:MAG UNVERIFIED_CONTAM: hypothetical protein LVR18_10135 [Planctomycetaceae bacterium]
MDYILADQPETPFYFAVMKRVNKAGPELVRNLAPVETATPDLLPKIARSGQTIDVAASLQSLRQHMSPARSTSP